MTNMDINEKVSEIRNLEAQINSFKSQIEAIKDLLKSEFDDRKVSTIHTDLFNLSYVPVYKNTLDGATLKKENPEMYAKYAKETSYLKFTILNKK